MRSFGRYDSARSIISFATSLGSRARQFCLPKKKTALEIFIPQVACSVGLASIGFPSPATGGCRAEDCWSDSSDGMDSSRDPNKPVTTILGVPKAIQDLLDELEASKQSRLRAWNVFTTTPFGTLLGWKRLDLMRGRHRRLQGTSVGIAFSSGSSIESMRTHMSSIEMSPSPDGLLAMPANI
jgi:hypothetical protein